MRRIVLVGAAALWLAGPACALAQSGAATFTPREENPAEYPDAPGRETTFYNCVPCHNFKLVAAQGLNRRQWDESIDWMIARHKMPVPDEKERQVMLNYLEKAFPPRIEPRGWQNPFLKQ